MRRKKIFIHVGYPKTGTTTLQKHFFPKINGIRYEGKFDNDENLYLFDYHLIDRLVFGTGIDCGYDFYNEDDDRKILLSEESFTSNCLRQSFINSRFLTPEPINVAKNIRSFFSNELYDVSIIFTIRRQDEMITSQYAQSYLNYYSRQKSTNTFKKFSDIFLNNIDHCYYKALDYYSVAKDFAEVFGLDNIHVFSFEDLSKNPIKFCSDILVALDEPYDEIYLSSITKCENKRTSIFGFKKVRSLTVLDQMMLLRSRFFPKMSFSKLKPLKKYLNRLILDNNDDISRTIFLTEEEKNIILDNYACSNKKLSEEFSINLKEHGYYND